ncbi:hypothetical protein [Blastomonas fulva]|uniref:hypothetical protein n=1 Tax=Blastomonas fulva TaxID=1550728 RepID=UPI003D29CC75
MNEETQIDAMMAELKAAGYEPIANVPAHSLDIPSDITLDLVGKWSGKTERNGRPALLIVEIANRLRRQAFPSRASGIRRRISGRAVALEAEARARFEAISDAVAKLDPEDVEFQIRFLDVSAEQAFARSLHGTKVRRSVDMLEEIEGTLAFLGAYKPESADHLQTTFLAHLWTRWLRIMANRWPGSRSSQMKFADVRAVQKDLFDNDVIKTAPADYFRINRSILALAEGGDVEWDQIAKLVNDLKDIVTRFRDHLKPETVLKLQAKTIGQTPQRREKTIFDLVEDQILEALPPSRHEVAQVKLRALRDSDGTPRYQTALFDLLRSIPVAREALGDLLDQLIVRADPALG